MNERAFVVANAAQVPAEALCDAFNASFAGYLVKFPTMDGVGWQSFLRRQGCDLSLSFAAGHSDVVLAFALVTPRPGRRTRIAVMGTRPEARGTGVAARLLDDAIAASAARGDRWVELEVFAQNERAGRLYRSRGMTPVDALYGYVATATAEAQDAEVSEVSREDGARWASAFDRDHPEFLPWQAGGEAILAAPVAVRVWRLGDAQMGFQDSTELASVTTLLDRDPAYANARRLLAAFHHRLAGRTLRAPQIHRESGPARAFEEAGWARQDLHQFLMRRTLAG